MKDLILMAVALIATINLTANVSAYSNAQNKYACSCTETAQIEAITAITNLLPCEELSDALAALNDEELTEILGL